MKNKLGESEAFLIDFVQVCKDEIFRGAPAEIQDALRNGLRAPRDDEDFMVVAYNILANHLPKELLRRDLIGDPTDHLTAQRRVALATIVAHPGWQRIHALEKHLVERTRSLREKNPDDWMHWIFLVFALVKLMVKRNLHWVQETLDSEAVTVSVGDTIESADDLMSQATELYRATLSEWRNEDDRPPFTKHDIWTALIQDKGDQAIAPPSLLVDERAVRVMENYGLSRREARVVVATMESCSRVLDLSG